jgi:hypothetical protein
MVWAERRDSAALLAADVACALDREFEWINIRDADSPESDAEAALLQRIGGPRVHRADVAEMAPDRTGGNVALWMAFRDRAAEPAVEHTIRFARLPEPIREVLSRTDPEGPTHGLVIAHADRAAHQYPDGAGTLRPYLDVLKRSNVSPVLMYGRPPRSNAVDFDVVLHLWSDGNGGKDEVTVERGAQLLEPFLKGRISIPLEEFLAGWRAGN